jgi:spermidine synthase
MTGMAGLTVRIVIFAAGAVLLGLEIAGSRVMAPYVGSSIYVWGSLISVFLIALSGGYLLGGRLADRWPRPPLLGAVLLLAGILLILLPVLAAPVLKSIVARDLGPRLGPFVAASLLFGPPGFILATTSPFAVRLAATDLGSLGSLAGSLYALSTAGNIAGTLVTSFVLIPLLGVRTILLLLGGVLVACALLLVPLRRRTRALVAAGVIGLLLVAPMRPSPAGVRMVYERDSLYHRIRVVEEDDGARYLVFNRSYQGGMYLHDPERSPYRYAEYMHAAWLFQPQIRRALVIGLGAGSIPKQFFRESAGISVDVAELDPAVVEVAKKYFALREDQRLRVFVADGRLFLRRTRTLYDLIVLDAYFAEGIPFHLATREFFALARSHLRPGGVVAANIIGALDGDQSALFRALYRTYAQVFPGLYLFPVGLRPQGRTSRIRTIVLMASSQRGITRRDLTARAERMQNQPGLSTIPLQRIIRDFYDRPIATAEVPVLTDDFAPVDILPVEGWEPERR